MIELSQECEFENQNRDAELKFQMSWTHTKTLFKQLNTLKKYLKYPSLRCLHRDQRILKRVYD